MELVKRCCVFLDELGVPITVFCRKVNICSKTFYDWKNGRFTPSEKTQKRIEEYISQYGF